MDGLEDKLVDALTELEDVVEAAAEEDGELGKRLRERLDTAMPALDDMHDELSRTPEGEGEGGE